MRSEFDGFLFGNFAKAEISDFNNSFVKQDVLRFEVVVDDFVRQLVKVADSADDLSEYQFGLFLRDFLVFFQVERKIGSFAKLQYCTE